MSIRYTKEERIDVGQLTELYQASTLAVRRPLDDASVVQSMIDHANLLVTAWDGSRLIGLARTLTDFGYVAYLADLVVSESHQRLGVGIELIIQTQASLGERAKVVLVAAPEAEAYYPRIGFRPYGTSWALGSREGLASRDSPRLQEGTP